MKSNNILIGHDSGIHLTDEENQLCVKCDELNIDIKETMNEREYELISKVVEVMNYYNENRIFNEGCSACRIVSCSVHIGHYLESL
jgi:hypothetical protein